MSLPIILALAAGAYILTTGKKSSSKGAPCPTNMELDVRKLQNYATEIEFPNGTRTINTPADALRAHDAGEKNIIAIAKAVLARQIPRRCMDDLSAKVSVSGPNIDSRSASVPEVVFHMASDIASDFVQMGRYSEADVATQKKNITNWWNRVAPGQPFPEE